MLHYTVESMGKIKYLIGKLRDQSSGIEMFVLMIKETIYSWMHRNSMPSQWLHSQRQPADFPIDQFSPMWAMIMGQLWSWMLRFSRVCMTAQPLSLTFVWSAVTQLHVLQRSIQSWVTKWYLAIGNSPKVKHFCRYFCGFLPTVIYNKKQRTENSCVLCRRTRCSIHL